MMGRKSGVTKSGVHIFVPFHTEAFHALDVAFRFLIFSICERGRLRVLRVLLQSWSVACQNAIVDVLFNLPLPSLRQMVHGQPRTNHADHVRHWMVDSELRLRIKLLVHNPSWSMK